VPHRPGVTRGVPLCNRSVPVTGLPLRRRIATASWCSGERHRASALVSCDGLDRVERRARSRRRGAATVASSSRLLSVGAKLRFAVGQERVRVRARRRCGSPIRWDARCRSQALLGRVNFRALAAPPCLVAGSTAFSRSTSCPSGGGAGWRARCPTMTVRRSPVPRCLADARTNSSATAPTKARGAVFTG
jgi:hypothetical protein